MMDFIKVSAGCPKAVVADIEANLENIKKCIDIALNQESKVIILPELCVTAYTCGDLFINQTLYNTSVNAIKEICDYSVDKDILIAIGAPFNLNNSLYNCAYIIFNGQILGIIPKSYIPNYSEFYEKRWFKEGKGIINRKVDVPFQENIPFGVNLIFNSGVCKFGFEICEDLWVTIPPSSYLSILGADIIGNLSASNEIVNKAEYRKMLVEMQSSKALCGYIYSSSGVFESSTDLVFSGHLLISETGKTIDENNRFQRENQVISAAIDIEKLRNLRLKNLSFKDQLMVCPFEAFEIKFKFKSNEINTFDGKINKHPFVPSNTAKRNARCKEIFSIQTAGLAKRLTHTRQDKVVIGISGGLDSTLALLVAVKTFDMLNINRNNVITVTMPGFGTTDRTYNNAISLCKFLNTDLREINIVDACLQHFKDIGHDKDIHDVTYENVQARERTQILMDIANKEKAILIGTGDLSELALGWCTYNGDHMSMYSVNCSIPKTLIRYLVEFVAKEECDEATANILIDILNTPVSPELLPKSKEGEITQKTEDIVGPYELHDFFLYHFIRHGATPEKIFFLAKNAFKEDYSEEVIEKWLENFIKRFFIQQFKRSALPDGPKVGTISLSPRGDWRMPSDASYNIWLNQKGRNKW